MLSESLEPIYTVGTDVGNIRQSKDEHSLFKSTFTNTTEREQEYSFKTERSTRSAATVIVGKILRFISIHIGPLRNTRLIVMKILI